MAKASEISDGSPNKMGEPYFCEECKRNHTKGKIYKEHLKFAKFDETSDVEEEIPVEEEEEFIKENFTEEELEAIEDFEDFEELDTEIDVKK